MRGAGTPVAATGTPRTTPDPEATVAALQRQLDSLLVRHAVLALALQELLRQADLPTARRLGRTLPQRVAALAQAVSDDDNATVVHEAAIEELRGLLGALWRR